MKTTISNGNTKLHNIPNVSLPPCKACNHNAGCKKGQCYALKAFLMYKNVRVAWDGNLAMATENRTKFFADIAEYCRSKKPRYFRWHVAGDILDQNYLEHMFIVARACPETRFLVFTKMHHLDYGRKRNRPKNLRIVFSMWDGFGDRRKAFPRAWMMDPRSPDPRIPSDALECPGSCENCMMCWNLETIGKDVVFVKH